MNEDHILYRNGPYWIRATKFGKTSGYEVNRDGVTAAVRVASIGYAGARGLRLAITEADRRAWLDEHEAHKAEQTR